MHLRKYLYLSLLVALSLVSCQTQRDGTFYQNVDQDEVQAGIIGNEDFEMEIAYVGAIGHSFIYECYVKNNSDQTMIIDKSQFYLEHGDGKIIFPSEGDQIAEALKTEGRKLKKEKKTARALGILGVGLSTLAGVSSGASVGESLLFSAEPIIYIFDEQRWYDRGIDSVEDEIAYVKEAQFDYIRLAPDQTIVRDLLFATTKMKSDVTVHFSYGEEPYSVTFPKRLYR